MWYCRSLSGASRWRLLLIQIVKTFDSIIYGDIWCFVSADYNESRISDTEELLSRPGGENESSENRAACTTPPLKTPPNFTPQTATTLEDTVPHQQHLNLEVSTGA